jgi:hypothetical protein
VCGRGPCAPDDPDTTFFLYDMTVDQAQLHNVAEAQPSIVSQIGAIMVQQLNLSHDPAMPPAHGGGGGGGGDDSHKGPDPAKAPCGQGFTTGTWWGGRNHPCECCGAIPGDLLSYPTN